VKTLGVLFFSFLVFNPGARASWGLFRSHGYSCSKSDDFSGVVRLQFEDRTLHSESFAMQDTGNFLLAACESFAGQANHAGRTDAPANVKPRLLLEVMPPFDLTREQNLSCARAGDDYAGRIQLKAGNDVIFSRSYGMQGTGNYLLAECETLVGRAKKFGLGIQVDNLAGKASMPQDLSNSVALDANKLRCVRAGDGYAGRVQLRWEGETIRSAHYDMMDTGNYLLAACENWISAVGSSAAISSVEKLKFSN
jgi:hypothetical protein